MKRHPATNQIGQLIKRHIPIALSFLLCHCGTEVGNGIAPEPKASGGSNSGTPTSAPTAEGATNDSAAPGDMISPIFSTSFLAACASPFAESMEGTFVNETKSFTVTLAADASKIVTPADTTGTVYTIKPAPNVSSYAIEALSVSPSVTCSAVTTQTLIDGSLLRSVTLSNGNLVQWTLSSGKVMSLKLTTAAALTESWTIK